MTETMLVLPSPQVFLSGTTAPSTNSPTKTSPHHTTTESESAQPPDMLRYRPSCDFKEEAYAQSAALVPYEPKAVPLVEQLLDDDGNKKKSAVSSCDANATNADVTKLTSQLQMLLSTVREANASDKATTTAEDFLRQVQGEWTDTEVALEYRATAVATNFLDKISYLTSSGSDLSLSESGDVREDPGNQLGAKENLAVSIEAEEIASTHKPLEPLSTTQQSGLQVSLDLEVSRLPKNAQQSAAERDPKTEELRNGKDIILLPKHRTLQNLNTTRGRSQKSPDIMNIPLQTEIEASSTDDASSNFSGMQSVLLDVQHELSLLASAAEPGAHYKVEMVIRPVETCATPSLDRSREYPGSETQDQDHEEVQTQLSSSKTTSPYVSKMETGLPHFRLATSGPPTLDTLKIADKDTDKGRAIETGKRASLVANAEFEDEAKTRRTIPVGTKDELDSPESVPDVTRGEPASPYKLRHPATHEARKGLSSNQKKTARISNPGADHFIGLLDLVRKK